jgi:chromosome transmission fidelity protein 1
MVLERENNFQETGQTFYENCCVRTINQTIGRGIRHVDDYANIYLIDYRFLGIGGKLSDWLQKRIKYVDYY